MKNWWWLIALILAVFALYFVFDYARDAYKLIPIDTEKVPEPDRYAAWYPYSSAEGGFSVNFPAPPQNATQHIAIPDAPVKRKYDMYVSETMDGVVYMVNVVTYPSGVGQINSDQILQANLNEMVESNPNNVLESVKSTSFRGLEALDFVISNNNLDIRGILFQVSDRVYILSTVGRKQRLDKEAFTHFLETFQLTSESGETS